MKYKSGEKVRLTRNCRNHLYGLRTFLPDLVYRIAWITDDHNYAINIEAANMRFTHCIAHETDILPASRKETSS